ncbi:nuclear transport factor 2 family protein [Streptomyces broussonetiae]|uniref:Nuclear transport factor 2 family protein n=1 Tax=Streptomyces broussonetiae TaxID=2686304 RepID=A0A6I6NFT2_9ACTN|nr:nuclear transport factor 2 family protein [Streptomyces broussonetiae]QHA10172.1 nuclear transport factor 2 family protein [Streptomyces broussonetiae]
MLLTDATFAGSGEPVSGRQAIEKMFQDMLIVYADGTPRTRHVTTNIAIEVNEQAGTAVSRSYVTVLQALPDLPLQPIAGGRYHGRFERRDEQWCFVERRVHVNLVGDVSRHLREIPAQRWFSQGPGPFQTSPTTDTPASRPVFRTIAVVEPETSPSGAEPGP